MRNCRFSQITEIQDTGLRLGARETLCHITINEILNLNPVSTAIQRMLTNLLDHSIKPAIEAQFEALEKMFERKMLFLVNIQTPNLDRMHEGT